MRLMANGLIWRQGRLEKADVAIDNGRIVRICENMNPESFDIVTDLQGKLLTPGFVDVHVHLREPGYFYKETMETGTLAAARGGYTAVCAMPNVNPVPDTVENLKVTLAAIEKGAKVRVYPYGCLTMGRKGGGEMADLSGMKDNVCGFSDDGTGVQQEETMLRLMKKVKEMDGIIAAHCEDEALVKGGCIHDGVFAREHNLPGICSESEWGQVERDVALAEKTGCRYHVCHVSAAETVEIVRQAQKRGVDVTCETGPHYLLLCDEDLQDLGRFKMNPPIRTKEDREALIEGLLDGTIGMIATDHAPHSAEEKSRGLLKSLMGVVGLETAFPMLYRGLVLKGKLTLEKLLSLMCDAPRERFRLPGGLEEGQAADMAVWDLTKEWQVDPENFVSLGKATPFEGMWATGVCLETIVGGKTVWKA